MLDDFHNIKRNTFLQWILASPGHATGQLDYFTILDEFVIFLVNEINWIPLVSYHN
jgi:hypothetical protein